MDYWKEQESVRSSMKKWEKEANDKDGQQYIQYVNDFSDNINNERYQIYNSVDRKATNTSFSKMKKNLRGNCDFEKIGVKSSFLTIFCRTNWSQTMGTKGTVII